VAPACNALHQLGHRGGDVGQLDDIPLRGLDVGHHRLQYGTNRSFALIQLRIYKIKSKLTVLTALTFMEEE
jgi:hypothetical protein